jgi:Flp pilus assembly protein protease CpaA
MVQAVIFGIIGFLTCFLLEYLYSSVTKKKCRVHELDIDIGKLDIKSKIVIYILNTVLWAICGLQTSDIVFALLVASVLSLGILTSMIDLQIHIIPNEFVAAMLIIGVLLQIKYLNLRTFLLAFACMIGMMALFLIVAKVIGMGKVGAGDVKLAGAMGGVLGYPDILTALMAMGIIILVSCFIGFATFKITLKSAIPMAPFLMIGMTVGFIADLFA